MANWVEIPKETAKTHKLYGVGGWLLLVVLGQSLAPFVIALGLAPVYRDVDFAALPADYRMFVYAELGLNALFAIWAWVNVWLISTYRATAVPSVAWTLFLSPVFIFSDALATKYMVEMAGATMTWEEIFDQETVRTLGRSIVGAAIWVPYMLVSRRVNVTYRHRVRENDPILQGAAEPRAA